MSGECLKGSSLVCGCVKMQMKKKKRGSGQEQDLLHESERARVRSIRNGVERRAVAARPGQMSTTANDVVDSEWEVAPRGADQGRALPGGERPHGTWVHGPIPARRGKGNMASLLLRPVENSRGVGGCGSVRRVTAPSAVSRAGAGGRLVHVLGLLSASAPASAFAYAAAPVPAPARDFSGIRHEEIPTHIPCSRHACSRGPVEFERNPSEADGVLASFLIAMAKISHSDKTSAAAALIYPGTA